MSHRRAGRQSPGKDSGKPRGQLGLTRREGEARPSVRPGPTAVLWKQFFLCEDLFLPRQPDFHHHEGQKAEEEINLST